MFECEHDMGILLLSLVERDRCGPAWAVRGTRCWLVCGQRPVWFGRLALCLYDWLLLWHNRLRGLFLWTLDLTGFDGFT